ncbi:MAG: hypothetical protein FJX78_09850 [Armatimonadetes bacterium]|nr:hypothetical protein [Armatimonadota bacterium]
MRCFRGELVDAATFDPRERMPRYSAYVTITPRQRTFLVLLEAILIASLAAAPVARLITMNLAINLLFAASVAFRFVTSFHGAKLETEVSLTADEVAALRDEDLPVYAVLCPMHKEAASAPCSAPDGKAVDVIYITAAKYATATLAPLIDRAAPASKNPISEPPLPGTMSCRAPAGTRRPATPPSVR